MFSSEFCEIFKETLSVEHHRVTASKLNLLGYKIKSTQLFKGCLNIKIGLEGRLWQPKNQM